MIPDEEIDDVLRSDASLAKVWQPMLNQLLQAETTEHLRAEPGEQTDAREDDRNGSYERRGPHDGSGAISWIGCTTGPSTSAFSCS